MDVTVRSGKDLRRQAVLTKMGLNTLGDFLTIFQTQLLKSMQLENWCATEKNERMNQGRGIWLTWKEEIQHRSGNGNYHCIPGLSSQFSQVSVMWRKRSLVPEK